MLSYSDAGARRGLGSSDADIQAVYRQELRREAGACPIEIEVRRQMHTFRLWDATGKFEISCYLPREVLRRRSTR